MDFNGNLPDALYLRKIKEMYNCIQTLWESLICFKKGLKSKKSIYKSFSSSGCCSLIRSLQNLIIMINDKKNNFAKEIGNIDNFIGFNVERLKYIFTFFYVANKNKLTVDQSVIARMREIVNFFSGNLPVNTSSKYVSFYKCKFFSREELKRTFNNDFFKTVKNMCDNDKNNKEKSLKERIELCDSVIEKLKKTYNSNEDYGFLNVKQNNNEFKSFYFNIENIDKEQISKLRNISSDPNDEFVIELTKLESKSEIENEIIDLNSGRISTKLLKDSICSFLERRLLKKKMIEVLECYNKLVNQAYINNNLDLNVIKDLLNIFMGFCNNKNENPAYCSFGIFAIFKFVSTYSRIIEIAYEVDSQKSIDLSQHMKQFGNIFEYVKELEMKLKSENDSFNSNINLIVSYFSFSINQNMHSHLDYWFLHERHKLFKTEDRFFKSFEAIYNKYRKTVKNKKNKLRFITKNEYSSTGLRMNLKRKQLLVICSNMLNLINGSYLNNKLDCKLVRRCFEIQSNICENGIYNKFNKTEVFGFLKVFMRLIELLYELKKNDIQNNVLDNITIEKLRKNAEQYKRMLRCFLKNVLIKNLSVWELKRLCRLISFFSGNNELKLAGYWFLKERYELFDVETTKNEFKRYYDEAKKILQERKTLNTTESEKDSFIEEENYDDSFVDEEIKSSDENEKTKEGQENDYVFTEDKYKPPKLKHEIKKEIKGNSKFSKAPNKKLAKNSESESEKDNSISLRENEDEYLSSKDKCFILGNQKKYNFPKGPRAKNKTNNTENTKSDLDSEFEKSTDKKVINKKRNARPLNDYDIN